MRGDFSLTLYLNLCRKPGTSYSQRFIHSLEKFPRRQQLHNHPLIYRLPVDLTVEHIIIQNSLIRQDVVNKVQVCVPENKH